MAEKKVKVNTTNEEEKKKKKKFFIIFGSILGAGAIVTAIAVPCVLLGGNSKAQEVKVDVPEINGLVFSNQKAYVGKDYSTEISIDITKTGENRLPDELKSVKSGNRTIADTEYTYDVADNKETADFKIPGKYIEGDVTIDLELVAPVPLKRWYEYTDWWNYCSNGKKENEATVKDIGKEVALTVNNTIHRVHLIGVDEDYEDDLKTKKIHTTFEFVDLISDSDGCSLATQWNDTTKSINYDYLNSSLRKALTGEGGGSILWAQKGKTEWSNQSGGPYTDKSVLNMLEESNPEFVKCLKAPRKEVMCTEDGTTWTSTKIKTGDKYDKLFILSREEIGNNVEQAGAYTHYKDDEGLQARRRKKQPCGDEAYITNSKIESGHKYTDSVSNFAGYYYHQDEVESGLFWLRDPATKNETHGFPDYAWAVNPMNISYTHAARTAYGVAPGFCI